MVELSPGAVFAGHRVEEEIGRGGMGIVYRATHLALDITVALKLIRPELARDEAFQERFKRESRLAASIEHPNVLPVRHAGDEDGMLYITMRYVEGTDLRETIDGQGSLDPALAVEFVAQVASALDAAHGRGLVHRDVKPANVLIEGRDGAGHVFLTDFGLTRQAASQGANLTKTGQWVGTLDYVAPEQIEGKHVDARADVYSLGCVLYESLAGGPPFFRDSEVATMYAHLNEPVPPLSEKRPGLPPALENVVERAMAKDPAERHESAGELGRAAKGAISGSAPSAAEPAGPPDLQGAPTVSSERPAAATAPAGGEETVAAQAGPPAPPAAAPGPVAPPPPAGPPPAAPPTTAREGGGKKIGPLPAGLFWVLLGVVVVGAIVGVMAVAGVFGGGGEDPEVALEADARELMATFEEHFSAQDDAGVNSLLASDAQYDYPGEEVHPAETEYKRLFNDISVADYQMDGVTTEAIGENTVEARASYEYENSESNFPFSGEVTMTLERPGPGAELEITEIAPIPNLFWEQRIPASLVPGEVSFSIRAGRFGSLVTQETLELTEPGSQYFEIPIDEQAAQSFDIGKIIRYQATVRGEFKFNGRLAYPYAT